MRGALALLTLMLLTILMIGPFQDAAGYPLTAGRESAFLPLSTGSGALWCFAAILVLSGIFTLGRK